jgi:large subunit ribosomal protein L30
MATQAKKKSKPEAKKTPSGARGRGAVAAGSPLKLTQIGSSIGRRSDQEATLKGLGLNKLNRTRTLADTPEIRGMIAKVRHLVKIEQA